MAEVAIGVLHNVGNVLNSVNVTANLLMHRLQNSRVKSLAKASDVVSKEQDLAAFFNTKGRGKHFPHLLEELATTLSKERDQLTEEIRVLLENVEHIKEIVSMQQSYAQVRGTTEPLKLVELVEDALKINDAGLIRHSVSVVREFEDIQPVLAEKHKMLQILVNLISNAKYGSNRF